MDRLKLIHEISRSVAIVALIGWSAFRYETGATMDQHTWAWIKALNDKHAIPAFVQPKFVPPEKCTRGPHNPDMLYCDLSGATK
jgi:hypothetical protein